MNETKFKELVNLYFDREISAAELLSLKKELAEKTDRRREFQSRYRLHRATCSALSLEDNEMPEQTASARRYLLPILSGLGIAACLLFALATSVLVLDESSEDVGLLTVKTSDPLNEVEYSNNEKLKLSSQSSLSSQLRLAGLTPDIAPSNQQLSAVDVEALRQKEAHLQDVIEQVNNYRTYSAIPEPRLVDSSARTYEAALNNYWSTSTSFKSSLAGFR